MIKFGFSSTAEENELQKKRRERVEGNHGGRNAVFVGSNVPTHLSVEQGSLMDNVM